MRVIRYNCSIRDKHGKLWNLKAYGLENITGAMSSINAAVIRRIFPRISDEMIQTVKRETVVVDFLVGSQHPSWHPKMKEQAECGGDMWLYECRYGACLGGRHPFVKEETKKSDSIFHVNHVYHVSSVVQNHCSSHAFEFCEDRLRKQSDNVQIVELPPESSVDVPNDRVGGVMSCESSVISPNSCDDQQSGVMYGPVRAESLCNENEVQQSESSNVVVRAACHICKSTVMSEERFLQSESMGAVVEPKCGGCQCGNCPVPGSLNSY